MATAAAATAATFAVANSDAMAHARLVLAAMAAAASSGGERRQAATMARVATSGDDGERLRLSERVRNGNGGRWLTAAVKRRLTKQASERANACCSPSIVTQSAQLASHPPTRARARALLNCARRRRRAL